MKKDAEYWGTGFSLRNGIGMTRVDEDGNQLIMVYNKWDSSEDGIEGAVESMSAMLRFFIDKKAIGYDNEIDVERDREIIHRLLREYLDSRVSKKDNTLSGGE